MASDFDNIDQCIVWWCDKNRAGKWGHVENDVRVVPTLHCRAHQEFSRVDQEETNGS